KTQEIGRALGIRTAAELREAAAEGRLRTVPGIGPKTEAQLLAGLAAERPRPQALRLNTARALTGAIAEALGGEPARDPRPLCDSCEQLAVVCSSTRPAPLLDRFAQLPAIR